MGKLTIALTNDEQSALYSIADQDLRLPEQVFRWLIRTEAAKRGLWAPTDTPVKIDDKVKADT